MSRGWSGCDPLDSTGANVGPKEPSYDAAPWCHGEYLTVLSWTLAPTSKGRDDPEYGLFP